MNNYILIIIYYSILSTVSVNSTKPKFCTDCKFFRNDLMGSQFGKCALFPEVKDNNDNDDFDYLVNGMKRVKPVEYTYCSISRKYDSMCGKDGKFYEKKNIKWPFSGSDN